MARHKKIAYEVKVSFLLRVIVNDNIDPEMDPEFNEATHRALKRKLNVQHVADNIETYNEDDNFPYNPRYDKT